MALVALSGLVFVCVTHLSQGHLETCQGRPNYSRLEKKRNGRISKCGEDSGKAVGKPGKHNGSFCLLF